MNLAGQFRMGFRTLLGAFGLRAPVNVMISVTDRCPSRCTYCQIPEQNRKDLSTNQWKTLLLEMHRAGTQRIGVWGGEPLMRDDIIDLCAFARKLGMYVSLDSNGYLIPAKKDVLDHIDHLVLAFDGPEEAHDANREPGSYKKVMQAIRMASGRIKLWTITVLTKNNIDKLDFIMETAKEFGFLTTFQTLHHNEKLGGDTTHLMPSREEYAGVYRKLYDMKKKGAPIALSARFLKSIANWPDFSKTRMKTEFFGVNCKAGRMYCNIDVDGNVYPCSLLIGIYPETKNALEIGFGNAFKSIAGLPCQSCTATCYTEYNYLYNLMPGVIFDWSASIRRTERERKRISGLARNNKNPESKEKQ